MRWTPFIAAGGLLAIAAFVALAGMRLAPHPEPTVPAPEQSSGQDELRWHPADPGNERQGRTVRDELPAKAPEQPALPPIAPPVASAPPTGPRAIEPSVVAVPEISPQELERIDPRPALSPVLPPQKKKPPKPLLFRPVAESAGVIAASGRRVTIADIETLPDAETCPVAGGGEWPCGRAARTAFRGLLRGRAVACDFPEGDIPDEVTVPCKLGRLDIGAWLVRNGWARPAGDNYRVEAEAAREAKRGIYGAGPGRAPAAPSAFAEGNTEPASDPGTTTSSTDSGSISILPSTALETAPERLAQPAPAMDDPAAGFPEAPAPPSGVSPLPPPSSPRP